MFGFNFNVLKEYELDFSNLSKKIVAFIIIFFLSGFICLVFLTLIPIWELQSVLPSVSNPFLLFISNKEIILLINFLFCLLLAFDIAFIKKKKVEVKE